MVPGSGKLHLECPQGAVVQGRLARLLLQVEQHGGEEAGQELRAFSLERAVDGAARLGSCVQFDVQERLFAARG